ncbi:MAG: LysR family transcriptional regulator [Oscillospiraceae bacterium]|nr:LysR family transcriptional regulator [Oscillospiraceae bacterium]
MDTKKIYALLTAVDRGSLTAAATELGYTQSGLTHMMNALETELGLNLLVRSKNGVHLSPAGQELLPKMRALMDAADELERSADHLRQRNFSTLRLGAYASVARQWLPTVLSEFRRVSPDTEVNIDVGGLLDLYEKLKNDQLDCAIVSYHEAQCQGLSYIPLRKDPLVAILPADYPLTRPTFPVEEFSGKDFLMPSAGFDLDINPIFSVGGRKLTPLIRHTNLDDPVIVSMVEHNLGVSILSELCMQDMTNDVRVVRLDPPSFRLLGIAMSERRSSDKNIRRFVKCARSVMEHMYPSEIVEAI